MKYLIINETNPFLSIREKYKLFSDKDTAYSHLKDIGWEFNGIGGSIGISEKIGIASTQYHGKSGITFIPIEEEQEENDCFEKEIPEKDVQLEATSEESRGFIKLTQKPSNGNPPVHMTIWEGAGGWNCGIFRWQTCEDGFGYYEPQVTGLNNTSLGTGLREDAIKEAIGWAEDEDLPYWIPENE